LKDIERFQERNRKLYQHLLNEWNTTFGTWPPGDQKMQAEERLWQKQGDYFCTMRFFRHLAAVFNGEDNTTRHFEEEHSVVSILGQFEAASAYIANQLGGPLGASYDKQQVHKIAEKLECLETLHKTVQDRLAAQNSATEQMGYIWLDEKMEDHIDKLNDLISEDLSNATQEAIANTSNAIKMEKAAHSQPGNGGSQNPGLTFDQMSSKSERARREGVAIQSNLHNPTVNPGASNQARPQAFPHLTQTSAPSRSAQNYLPSAPYPTNAATRAGPTGGSKALGNQGRKGMERGNQLDSVGQIF
jgi:hypothetical protein